MFENTPKGLPDPILQLNEIFIADQNAKKVNLGIGVYKNNQNKTPILEVVKIAEQRLVDTETDKNYLLQIGLPLYNKLTQELILGENSQTIKEERAVTMQTISGTNAIRIAGEFIKDNLKFSDIWLSDPCYPNHESIFNTIGLNVKKYGYYNNQTNLLDWEKLKKDLSEVKKDEIVLLQPSCHNPTGLELTNQQWDELLEISIKAEWIPLFDIAYQGFANSLAEDVYAVRQFAEHKKEVIILNSYSKIMGLYGERIGTITIVAENKETALHVAEQLKTITRAMFSSASSHGSKIVATVLSDKDLKQKWELDVQNMRDRLNYMRSEFIKKLQEYGCKKNLSFLSQQKGMFSYTGLSGDVILKLRNDYSIYMLNSGRINVAGLTEDNIDYVCKSITEVVNNLS